MFSSLSEGVTLRDPNGDVVYANPAALAQLGLNSFEELLARPRKRILEELTFEDERGQPLTYDELPGVQMAVQRKASPPMMLKVSSRRTGQTHWWRTTTTPLYNEAGEFLGAMNVTEDTTALRTAELRTRVLAESGAILASSLEYEKTLNNVAEVAVLLADYCSVDLIDERRVLRRAAAAHVAHARRQLIGRLGSLQPVALGPEHPVMRVLDTNEPALYTDMSDAEVAAVARDPEHLELLRALDVRSMLIVPLRVPARTLGVMTMATDVSRRRLSHDDVALAEQLARRAAVATENARLHTKLAGIAETLQSSLLPPAVPNVPGWEIGSLYQPAATEFRVDVGGDFYDVFEAGSDWFAILGDVTGKGVGAAAVTGLMRHGARVAAAAQPDPASILGRLDEALAEQPGRAMATAVCMRIRGSEVTISSAGHPPAMIVQVDGRLREFPPPDPMLGAFDKIRRSQRQLKLGERDLVVIYTDGVPDTPSSAGRFGMDRLMRVLSSAAGLEPQSALERLSGELARFRDGSGGDDVAALALRPVTARSD